MSHPRGFFVILGDPEIGGTLVARPNGIKDTDGIRADGQQFQWLRDGTPIPGETDQLYVIKPDDAGAMISAKWTYQDLRGVTKDVISKEKLVPDVISDAIAAIYTLVLRREADLGGAKFYADHFRAGVALSALVQDMESNRAKGAR